MVRFKSFRSVPWAGLWLAVVSLVLGANDVMGLDTTATVDRNPIRADETVHLILQANERISDHPDLTPLNLDFDVLHTSSSTQVDIVNGRQDATTQWLIELAPKREGEFIIPPIAIGQERTEPVALKVLPIKTSEGEDGRDMFLEVELQPEEPYVQSQLIYILRLFHAVNLLDGSLDEPAPQNALVERLGKDVSFEAHRNGRRYRVIERKYAMFPQASGEVLIPPVQFVGQIADATQRQFGFTGFFDRGRSVRLRTEAIQVKVRPRPSAYPDAVWLPAQELTLTESWSETPPQFRVGEPVTRTLRMEARGLSGVQLPQLAAPSLPSVKVYPDQANAESRQEGAWVVGTRVERMALVPGRAGEATLPEIIIPWWDVTRNQGRVAVIPARRITILPALADTAGQAPVDTNSAEPLGVVAPGATAVTTRGDESQLIWQGISLALFCAWLITILAWWRHRKTKPEDAPGRPESPTLRSARKAIHEACERNDPVATKAALLSWAQAKWQSDSPRSLGRIGLCLGDTRFKAELEALDQVLYARSSEAWDGATFWSVAQQALSLNRRSTPAPEHALPPLYPGRHVSEDGARSPL